MRARLKKDALSNERRACRVCVGFTLIELLVVIAIITLLMAIMLPALSRARLMSVRLVCKNNLKQIAFAWEMYLDDNGEKFYQGMLANMCYGGGEGIMVPDQRKPLNRYLSLPELPDENTKAKVFKCPGDDGSLSLPFYESVGTSYQTNILLIGQNGFGAWPAGSIDWHDVLDQRLSVGMGRASVASPARVLLLGDYTWGSQWMVEYEPGVSWHHQCCHFNMAFVDGHVDFLKIRKGLLVTGDYCVLPFRDLYEAALNGQDAWEEPCEFCE